ncbi:hypothetical protein [uncultured Microbacterium sp.]|uniref:hypothetical protein n=1 Tax=uncultured Microbacterium sp. TaxID=191216 RepID=UPI0025DC0569|nr:hypothetical protein [uncultured Microbacterium sp.]
MGTIITSNGGTITPSAVIGWESTRDGRTIVHQSINRSEPDATLRPAGLRKGRMEISFATATSEADSAAAETLLATASVFSVISTDKVSVQLAFVIPDGGNIARTLSPTTGAAWNVAFDWVEVTP